MKTLTFRAAAENELASPTRMTASFDIDLDDEIYALLAEKLPRNHALYRKSTYMTLKRSITMIKNGACKKS